MQPEDKGSPKNERGDLCMKGGVYGRKRYPVCHRKFVRVKDDLLCPRHKTRPKRFYIRLYSREAGKHLSIYSDSRNAPFSSFEEAHRILTKIRAEIDAGSFDPTHYVAQKLKPLRFRNWSSEWLKKRKIESEKKLLSPSYLKELKRFARMFQDYFKDQDIRDISTKKVNDFYLTLKVLPNTSAISCHACTRCFRTPLSEKILRRYQNSQSLKSRNRTSIQLTPMNRTQMVRPSETRALFWEDLDFKHDRVTIRRHFSLKELKETTKSKRIKTLPLDSEVRESLLRLPRHITSPFVFQKNGRPYSESYARKLWNRTASQVGIKISFYKGTRHSSATEAVNRVGMDRVQEFLGHSRSTMTRRYAKMNAEGLRPVLRKERMDSEISTTPKNESP